MKYIAAVFLSFLLAACNADGDKSKSDNNAKPNQTTNTNAEKPKPFFRYSPKDNAYSIDFPKQPQEMSQPQEVSQLGTLTTHLQAYEDKATQTAFLLSYTDYPVDALAELVKNRPDAIANLLQDTKQGVLRSLGVAPTTETPTQIAGHQGLEFTANNGALYGHYQLFLVRNRLYQLGVLRNAAPIDEQAAAAFFASFSLNSPK